MLFLNDKFKDQNKMIIHCAIQIAHLCTKIPFNFTTKLTKRHGFLATFIVFMTFPPIQAHRCDSEANKYTSSNLDYSSFPRTGSEK